MQKITCLADVLLHVPRVRVIKENDTNYGNDFGIMSNDYNNKIIWIKPNNLYQEYQYSEIQFLTPVQYEWRFIGFGDKVNGKEIYGYSFCGEWIVDTTTDYNKTVWLAERDIYSFEPLHQLTPKIELTTEEMIAELQRRWVVTEGKIINN